MKKTLILSAVLALSGCATQAPMMQDVEPGLSAAEQRQAQAEAQAEGPEQLALKRKIAVGRLSNETNHGRSLLRGEGSGDELSRKVTDMFLQALTNSGNYLVFERTDIELLTNEAELSGQSVNIIGVDTLVIGSLTQFGRVTTGESGFVSSTLRQEATATVDIRFVDVSSGRVFDSVTGSGSSATETSRTMGFGTAASYDGSLNDQAIAAAVIAVVDKMTELYLDKPWTADVLAEEEGLVFISGGESQGVKSGMSFDIETRGRQVESQTTGTLITLPGRKVAELQVVSLFGQDVLNQGAAGTIISGSIEGYDLSDLLVKEQN